MSFWIEEWPRRFMISFDRKSPCSIHQPDTGEVAQVCQRNRHPTISLQAYGKRSCVRVLKGCHARARGRPVQVSLFGQRSFRGAWAFSTRPLPGMSRTLPAISGFAHLC